MKEAPLDCATPEGIVDVVLDLGTPETWPAATEVVVDCEFGLPEDAPTTLTPVFSAEEADDASDWISEAPPVTEEAGVGTYVVARVEDLNGIFDEAGRSIVTVSTA